jgi:ABC-type transporter Mla subunit MlaD
VYKPKGTAVLLTVLACCGLATIVGCTAGFVSSAGFTRNLKSLSGGVLGAADQVVAVVRGLANFLNDLPTAIAGLFQDVANALGVLQKLAQEIDRLVDTLQDISRQLTALDEEL